MSSDGSPARLGALITPAGAPDLFSSVRATLKA
jgi:hypothetical protein